MQKNYHLYWTAGRVFAAPFSMLFPKAPASCGNVLLIVTCMSSKDMSQIFKIFFQTGDINIFVFFSRYV